MKKLVFAVSIVLLGTVAVVATAAVAHKGKNGHGGFHANLNGYEEAPLSISTTGQGRFALKIDRDAKTIEYRLRFQGLEGGTASAAHVHLGQRRTAGGVLFFLCGGQDKPACTASQPITGTVLASQILAIPGQGIEGGASSFDEVVRAIRAKATYANVHTPTYPGGEIRGQIHRGHDHGHGQKHDDDDK